MMHKSVRYNCRAIFYNKQLLLLRPKMFLATGGNYREERWFTPWTKTRQTEEHLLPKILREATGQTFVPFGVCLENTVCWPLCLVGVCFPLTPHNRACFALFFSSCRRRGSGGAGPVHGA